MEEPNSSDMQQSLNHPYGGNTSPIGAGLADYDLEQSNLALLKAELKVNSLLDWGLYYNNVIISYIFNFISSSLLHMIEIYLRKS